MICRPGQSLGPLGGVQQLQDGPGQNAEPHPGRQSQQRRQPEGGGGVPPGGGPVPPGQGRPDGGDQADGQRIDKRRRKGEQVPGVAVHPIKAPGLDLRQAPGGLQDAHGDGLVQQIDDGKAHGAHGDGHTDGQQLAQDVPPPSRVIPAPVPGQVRQHPHAQGQQRQSHACRDPGDGPGGGYVGGIPLPQQPPGKTQAHHQLAAGFDDLAGGGGPHVAQALGIAPDHGHQAHAQHRRRQHPDGVLRLGIVHPPGQVPGQEEHHAAADGPQQQKQPEGHGHRAPPPVHPAQSLRLGHQPRQGQGKSGGGHHQQQIIDIVRGIEIVHALLVQQVSQGDLIQGPDGLGDEHGDGQQRSAA